VTLSKVDVLSVEISWLVTARPTNALDAIEIVAAPTVVHVLPSADMNPVTVPPLRVSFSHCGDAWLPPPMYVVAPPVADRVMNSRLPFGRASRMTCADPDAVVSRSMTPALANVLVFCRPVTRATICPSPLSG
jgi:hypothetical protein